MFTVSAMSLLVRLRRRSPLTRIANCSSIIGPLSTVDNCAVDASPIWTRAVEYQLLDDREAEDRIVPSHRAAAVYDDAASRPYFETICERLVGNLAAAAAASPPLPSLPVL